MKPLKLISIVITLLSCINISAQKYVSTDAKNVIEFYGDHIRYDGKVIKLGPKSLFIDGQLSDNEANKYPYVFNSFQSAAKKFIDGTEKEPMNVYIAPWVYWIDDPDNPAIRVGEKGKQPTAMTVKCEYLHLTGLNPDAHNVVLAVQRGQTQGAIGNYLMFDFYGDGLTIKDMTLGNFCNVDLDFPLKPALSRKKRMPAITQAHVANCHGDKAFAQNVRFISRLNMTPLSGARRLLFDHCHLESTDDALAGHWRVPALHARLLRTEAFLCHRQLRCGVLGLRFQRVPRRRPTVFLQGSSAVISDRLPLSWHQIVLCRMDSCTRRLAPLLSV